MTHLFSTFIVALAAVFGASLGHAEVRIGLAVPLTGPLAWSGAVTEQSAELAIVDLNARGGVLGEDIELITADDYCDAEQAVAAANKLIEAAVPVVIGHQCSGAAIPASQLYEEAGIILISHAATNPQLTEQGFTNVFRVIGRDDLQGRIAGDLLAKRWSNKPIAILHDGQAYGKGLAEETKKRLNELGIAETMFEAIEPGQADYWDIIQNMRATGVEVLYYGGYPQEAGLIVRQARAHGYELQLVAGDGIGSAYFGLIAGPASNGTLVSLPLEPANPKARALSWRFTPDIAASAPASADLKPYAAVQVWAQAVEIAGSFETEAVAEALRSHQFDTVLGRIGFDATGDVTGYETFVWYVWKDGKKTPLDQGKLTD